MSEEAITAITRNAESSAQRTEQDFHASSAAQPSSFIVHRSALLALQARLIELLLRHDEQSLRRYLVERRDRAPQPEDTAMRQVRRLAVCCVLGDELLGHILPAIVQGLASRSQTTRQVEEPPARGQIEWERTLQATWREHPGEPPLWLATRQRQRRFATPENLLAVGALLEYRTTLQQAASGIEPPLPGPVQALLDRIEHACAYPPFAGLREAAAAALQQGGLDALAAQATERLPPGHSAYADLLGWRWRFQQLRLHAPEPAAAAGATVGADPHGIEGLYRAWLFYELADLLRGRGCLLGLESTPSAAALHFRWGTQPTCRYVLYEHEPADQRLAAGGYRPFYLARVVPPPAQVWQQGRCHWYEPGALLAASYGPPASVQTFAHLVAHLALSAEQWGVLLAATPPGTSPTVPGLAVFVREVQPGLTPNPAARLAALLDTLHSRLAQPRTPRCQGVFLDTLSAAEAGAVLPEGVGLPTSHKPGDLLVCPKPHIGPWRVDLVSRTRDCCQDAARCHIVGQPDIQRPVRPPRSTDELLAELQHILAAPADADLDEAAIGAIARRVESMTRRFAEIAGAYRQMGLYEQRLRDLGMSRTLALLGAAERESLALAIFLVEQLDTIGASDYSAPVIHIAGVVELEVQRRVMGCPDLVGAAFPHGRPTLGTLHYMRRRPERTEGDWERLQEHVARYWQGRVDPDTPDEALTFDAFIDVLNDIRHMRNRAAHTNPVARDAYTRLFRMTCQAGRLRIGALNVLLLAWQVGNEPG